ncbi:MAG: SPASM domain-containing protein [Deltaproteobacteria bacterium]|nr:SPASM domain-containing protein [Deltaproteobacteria bacterium]
MLKSEGLTEQHDFCGAGDDYLSIHSNGDVYPCNFLPILLGNIFQNSLQEIIIKADEFVQNVKQPNNAGCIFCSKFDLCQGGCLAYKNTIGFNNSSCFYGGLC